MSDPTLARVVAGILYLNFVVYLALAVETFIALRQARGITRRERIDRGRW